MGNNRIKHISREERLQRKKDQTEFEQALQNALQKNKGYKKSFTQLALDLFDKNVDGEYVKDDQASLLWDLFEKYQRSKYLMKRRLFRDLLLHLNRQNCHKMLSESTFLIGLFNISDYINAVKRPIEGWRKNSHNPEKQFSSLLRFCFSRYHVPGFLDKAWMIKDDKLYRQWFVSIGEGISIRMLNALPIKMTKKIAHAFSQAPDHLTIEEALRWAQVMGKGGDERLAQQVIASNLARNAFVNEEFWETVIDFFIKSSMCDVTRIEEIVDYLNYQCNRQVDFTMKGRTFAALIRQSDAWHAQVARERNRGGKLCWKPSGIHEMEIIEENAKEEKIYNIIELCSSNELLTEGRTMKNCVATYARSCYTGRCAIFSLKEYNVFTNEKTSLATIEVELKSRRIVQAKAKYNNHILPKARQIMKQWAAQQQLDIAYWI